jgi:phosphatidylglycerophosphate synthase
MSEIVRIQQSVLAAAEKRALIWLAVRMPGRVNSDHLTALALAAMVGAGASYWLAAVTPVGLVLATLLLAVNWFGDSLDGTLARVRQQQRPRYGYYVDHVVDAIGAAALLGGLALSGYMHPGLAIALLLAYYLVSLEVYLAAHSLGRFQMSFFRMGPTELRLLLAAGNIVLLIHPTASVMGGAWSLFDVGGAVGAIGLVVTFLTSAFRNTRQLYREEPLPARPSIADTAARQPPSKLSVDRTAVTHGSAQRPAATRPRAAHQRTA